MFDASEAGLVHILAEARAFGEEFQDVVISNVVTDYPEIRANLREARDLLLVRVNDRETRETYANACEQLFDTLKPALDRLDGARDDLLKMKDDKAREAERRASDEAQRKVQKAYYVAAIAIAFATLLFTRITCATSQPPSPSNASAKGSPSPP